ncbi:MAG TPA: RimK family alpha-L-glutamate ligase [Candidatus Bathyarchaeota archaeon]|nr:RimK family alpha-L-glutamate ligase [Candidatus Bathyarchaeota archaeon]
MMKVGILTRRPDAWCSSRLAEAFSRLGAEVSFLSFRRLSGQVSMRPLASHRAPDLRAIEELDALVIRPIGRGSLEQIIFRMDLLRRLEAEGVVVVNPPEAIEICSDKYHALWLMESAGIPVPRTVATEDVQVAMRAFYELGRDVVVKPLFGSRGIGSVRATDPDAALRLFRSIAFQRGVIYMQEFIPHGNYDVRAFVIGGRVVAAMRRVARGWKKNVYLGARPEPYELPAELEELAVRAAEATKCEVAGVDILPSERGPLVIEVNSQPSWRGLQSVSKTDIAMEIARYVLSRAKDG